MTKNEPTIILWDLETLPNLTEVMKRLPSMGQWPGRTLKADINSIICFGYKVLGDKKSNCINAWDFENWKEDVNDDSALVMAIYEVLRHADGIVTHNGNKFDIKVLNTRLMSYGLPPLPKIPHVDTKVVAKRLMLYSNRLGDVSSFLGGESKLENGGWNLWCKVQNRDKQSMDLMTKYCKQDVEVLEQVYNGLVPLMKNIPNYNLFTREDHLVCPSCGSSHLNKHGKKVTKTRTYERLQCQDCGSVCSVNAAGTQATAEGI